jgi:tetratricopeptide (TPR) repeat protein
MVIITRFIRVKKIFLFSVSFIFLLALSRAFAVPIIQEKNVRVETLLAQADAALQKGEYKSAIDSYLEAKNLAENKIDLSRAYFGLSLSYFYLRDMVNAKTWIRKVLEVDPQKEISTLFYPETFVQLFGESKREFEVGQISSPEPSTAKGTEEIKAAEKAPPSKSLAPLVKPEASKQLGPGKRSIFPSLKELAGKWEVEVHYGSWSLNPIKGLFESKITDKLTKELRDDVLTKIRKSHMPLVELKYEQNVVLDSDGSNYGMEFRYYPRGHEGSFSLGLSFEKTNIKLRLTGPVKQEFTNGSYTQVESDGYLETNPFTTDLSFRWDFKPLWRVSPYFVFGIGLASLNGNIGYSYTGNYYFNGAKEPISDSDAKNFKEAEEEIDFNIPNIFPLLQISFGLRGEIYHGLTLRVEAGIWDGIVFRGGIAYRF